MDEAAERARRTYDAAADHYDDPALAFWARAGNRTVERLGLRSGAAVLDVPCGTGASALPAARAVGPTGTFRRADMRSLGYPDGSFDAVVSVFGIFFVPDMPALAAELWRMVRPGGTLAVTTWGPGPFEPGAAAFWEAVASVRPDLVRAFSPWEELVEPDALVDVLARGGIEGAVAEAEDGEQPMGGADDWWAVILGTGYRGTFEALSRGERERVERHVREAMADGPPVRTPLVLATARKPVGR